MQKNRKKFPPVTKLFADGDIHFAYGPIADREMAEAAVVHDAADDRRWLRRHPTAKQRRRPASERELAGHGLPPGTEVVVTRGPWGSQLRSFQRPRKASSN